MNVIYQSLLLSLFAVLLIGPVAAQPFGDAPGSSQTCEQDADCPLINCFVAPCPAAVCRDGLCGIEDNPPNPECVQDSDCPQINCFAAPCDVNVCNGGLCELQPPPGENQPTPNNNPPSPECVQNSDCPVINCFVAPCDVNVCNGGLCELQPPPSEEPDNLLVPEGTPCGSAYCTGGEPCCNPSCGICGQICTEQFCLPDEEEVVPEDSTLKPTNDTMMCTTNGDCPSLTCLVAPCYQYFCNTTAGECVLGEDDRPCGVNITCDDLMVLNASVAGDVSATDGEDAAVSKTNGDDNPSTNSAESRSSQQFILRTFVMAAMVATSLLVFL